MAEQYLQHSRDILSSDRAKFKFNERRGLGRISIFGYQNIYDLSKGFPLLTTKRVSFKNIAHELSWFLKGDTNIKYLVDNGVHIWDDDAFNYNLRRMAGAGIFSREFPKFSPEWFSAKQEYVQRVKEDSDFAARWAGLGPVYGSQWIHWPKHLPIKVNVEGEEREVYLKDPSGIDQIATVINGMIKDPTSSRHLVSAWNPEEVPSMALPPCHTMFQLNSDGKTLDLQLYQRSCDLFLGVPYNLASYSLLAQIFADKIGLKPGDFVHTFGDVHFYSGANERAKWYRENLGEFKTKVKEVERPIDYGSVLSWLNERLPPESEGMVGMDHVTGALEQLQRTPRGLPRVIVKDKPHNKLTIDDFVLEGYEPHPTIKRALAV